MVDFNRTGMDLFEITLISVHGLWPHNLKAGKIHINSFISIMISYGVKL